MGSGSREEAFGVYESLVDYWKWRCDLEGVSIARYAFFTAQFAGVVAQDLEDNGWTVYRQTIPNTDRFNVYATFRNSDPKRTVVTSTLENLTNRTSCHKMRLFRCQSTIEHPFGHCSSVLSTHRRREEHLRKRVERCQRWASLDLWSTWCSAKVASVRPGSF